MTQAYVLIEASPGKAIDAVKLISKIEGVKQVHLVTGPYDVIAFAEAPDLKTLGDVLVKKMQSSGLVAKTLTCVVVE
jgi:DNA-binding Lrp family transcriptional regulator